jgi:hypothetical protein
MHVRLVETCRSLYFSSTSEGAGRLHGVAGANLGQKRVPARRFPESRRKAYYLMSIHEHLPPQAREDLKEVGWTKELELARDSGR